MKNHLQIKKLTLTALFTAVAVVGLSLIHI